MNAPRKPRWKRKRWIATAVLWLLLSYLSSMGPMYYAWHSAWISADVVSAIFRPVYIVEERSLTFRAAIQSYINWWDKLYYRRNPLQITLPDGGYLYIQPTAYSPAENTD